VKYRPKVLQLQQRERIIQIQDRRQDMTDKNPRRPELAEFDAILKLAGISMYGEYDENNSTPNLEEWTNLRMMLEEAREDGRFILSYAASDTPGYCGPIAFMIWPDTSVTMYRFSSMDLPSFNITKGSWYQCDSDGMPWI
jgi:hypothetical protein